MTKQLNRKICYYYITIFFRRPVTLSAVYDQIYRVSFSLTKTSNNECCMYITLKLRKGGGVRVPLLTKTDTCAGLLFAGLQV